MLTNAGRMVAAMAMVTGSVAQSRRGGFMSANSAVQHLSTGLGAYLGGQIKIIFVPATAPDVALVVTGQTVAEAKPGKREE